MRYSIKLKYVKYVKGYGFLSFARRFGNKYGTKLLDTATKTEIDSAKTASKRVAQKTAKATGDLIGNKIADQISSVGKTKSKEKKMKGKVFTYHQKKATNYWWLKDYFRHSIKMEYQKKYKHARYNIW